MKVLLINGSPHKEGCTYTALAEVGKGLALGGVESRFFQLGVQPVRGCIACGGCNGKAHCVFSDDVTNALIDEMRAADGIVIGSPVYFAAPNGALCAVLDRAYYVLGSALRGKPGAAIVSCRRAGSTASLDRLNKYFTISQMPVVSSQFWNMVHGHTPEDVRQDEEGLQIMRTLGRNMAFMLSGLQGAGTMPAEEEPRMRTNFIR